MLSPHPPAPPAKPLPLAAGAPIQAMPSTSTSWWLVPKGSAFTFFELLIFITVLHISQRSWNFLLWLPEPSTISCSWTCPQDPSWIFLFLVVQWQYQKTLLSSPKIFTVLFSLIRKSLSPGLPTVCSSPVRNFQLSVPPWLSHGSYIFSAFQPFPLNYTLESQIHSSKIRLSCPC